MSVQTAPNVLVTWNATALGSAFGGYRVYRRPARTPVASWSLIGQLDVPTGYTASVVEAQHNSFVDYEAGWAFTGGQWASGWDYAVTVFNAVTSIESPKSTIVPMITSTSDSDYWAVSNLAPWLNFPVSVVEDLASGDEDLQWSGRAAARDLAIVRTPIELPARRWELGIAVFDRLGEDPLRALRAANTSGATMTVHTVRGDRLIGALSAPRGIDHDRSSKLDVKARTIETVRDPNYVIAQFNRPAGYVLNGSSQYLTVPDSTLINPGSGPFSVLVAGVWAGSAGSRYAVSKGNLGAADGWAVRTTGVANQVELFLDGASAAGSVTDTSAVWFDGNVHAFLATHSGTAQVVYRDGVQATTGVVAPGAITNAVALAVGANNAGASGFMAMAPFHVLVYWPRVLTPAEALASSKYVLGHPNTRLAPGANLALDLRDTRGWNGISAPTDLSGNTAVVTVAASPSTRGIPWPLYLLDRF